MSRADNLATFICRLSINSGTSTSWSPKGFSRPVEGLIYMNEAGRTPDVPYSKKLSKRVAN